MLIENVILGRRGFLPLAALTGFGLYGCSKSGTITTPTTSAADVEMFNQLIVAATTFDYKTFFTLLEEYSKSPERSKDYKQVLEHAVKIADDKKANEQFLVHDTYMKNKITPKEFQVLSHLCGIIHGWNRAINERSDELDKERQKIMSDYREGKITGYQAIKGIQRITEEFEKLSGKKQEK